MRLILEHVDCDLCGCSKYQTIYRKPDNWIWPNQFEYPVVKCIDCGLVYVNPRPIQEEMSKFYPKEYHEDRDKQEWLDRYKVQTEYLPELKNEKILDIGCAEGDFLIYLKKIYPLIRLYGADPFSKWVKSDAITFKNDLLPQARFNDNEFDIITAWAVFEHLNNPSEYFAEVYRILKKGGRFIFLVTNSESLYGQKAYCEDVPRHTYHFSKETLNKYAAKYGFQMANCSYDDRIWDGRGTGTFYYAIQNFLGVTWEKRYYNDINACQRKMGHLGRLIDKLVFNSNWEARKQKSGIMIVEFIK